MPRSRPISCSLARTSFRVVSPKLRTFRSWSSDAADQVADGGDPFALQAVGGPDGELELGQAHVELALELGVERHVLMAVVGARLGGQAGAGLVVLDERVQVLAEDLGGLDQGHLGAEHAGGPDPQDQLVVVGPLADAGVLDVVLDAVDRAEAGVDRDDADLEVVGVAFGGGPVAAAVLDGHLEVERHVVGQRAEDVLGIDDLDRLVVEDVGGRDDAAAVAVDPDRPRVLGVVLDDQAA